MREIWHIQRETQNIGHNSFHWLPSGLFFLVRATMPAVTVSTTDHYNTHATPTLQFEFPTSPAIHNASEIPTLNQTSILSLIILASGLRKTLVVLLITRNSIVGNTAETVLGLTSRSTSVARRRLAQ